MDVIYGVILSVSLGAFAAGGLPSTLSGTHRATTIWLLLAAAVFVFAVDSWYLLTLRIDTLQLDKERNRWRVPVLIVAMTITSFLPFQFLTRSTTSGYWPRHAEPTNLVFAANLATAIAAQVFFIAIARAGITRTGELQLRHEAAVAAGTRLLSVIVFVALIFGPITHSHGRDRPAMSLLLIGSWIGARVAEVAIALYVKSHVRLATEAGGATTIDRPAG